MSLLPALRASRARTVPSRLLAAAALVMLALLVFPATPMAHAVSTSPTATITSGISVPNYVAFDPSGNLWVSNDGGAILEYSAPFSSSSTPINYVLEPETGCNYPYGIGFTSTGDLWVVDNCTQNLYEYTAPLSPSSTPAVTIETPTDCPYGLAIGPSNSVWIADPCSGYLFEYTAPFTSESEPSNVVSAGECPTDIAFDSSGDLWYVDGCLDTATDLGQAPYTSVVKSVDTTPGCPQGIAFDSSGNLWVSDPCYGEVQEFAPPFTGEAVQSLTSPLQAPNGIAFDSSGNLWVADLGYDGEGSLPAVYEYSAAPTPVVTHISLPAVLPENITVNFNFADAPTLTGHLIGLYGAGEVLYNVPGYNATTDIFPYVTSACSDSADNTIQISGFFSAGPGLNSTEILVSNWQSFSANAAGWPSEPACTT